MFQVAAPSSRVAHFHNLIIAEHALRGRLYRVSEKSEECLLDSAHAIYTGYRAQ